MIRYPALLLLLLALALPARASASSDEDLLALDARWNTLRLQPDVPALEALLADDWMLTHSDGRVQHKADYLEELRTRSRSNQRTLNEDVRLRRYGDTAVVTGTSIQSGLGNGQPWSGRFRFTRVWVRRDGVWRMVASHSSRIADAP